MTLLDAVRDFSNIGMFQRSYAIEICDFAALQMADGQNMNQYITAQEQNYLIYLFRCQKDACCVLACDKDYPSRAAFCILREVASEFEQNKNSFPSNKSQVMQKAITQYQNPANADKILKIQQNIDETQRIMVLNLEQAIGRGESIGELAAKADNLSDSSKLFLRDTKKLNKCCSVI